jgi:hypothetical protein
VTANRDWHLHQMEDCIQLLAVVLVSSSRSAETVTGSLEEPEESPHGAVVAEPGSERKVRVTAPVDYAGPPKMCALVALGRMVHRLTG